MDIGVIALCISAVLAVVASLFGARYAFTKKKAQQLEEVIRRVVEAWEDDKVTAEEYEKIMQSMKEFLGPA